MTRETELIKCDEDPWFFAHNYVWIKDFARRRWIPFHLWPEQRQLLQLFVEQDLLAILKARQLGLTWLYLAYGLHQMLFRPPTHLLLFSRRDDEAMDLLKRLSGMHDWLPPWLKATIGTNNEHVLEFSGLGSVARAYPAAKHSGRSYTGTIAMVDEADFIPWLDRLLSAVKPTIDAGGQLCLASTSNKERPNSEFKRIWREGVEGLNNYHALFLPWWARPDRDQDWYHGQQEDLPRDDLLQEYPATPEEALAQRASAKRFEPEWLARVHVEMEPTPSGDAPAIPDLIIYREPVPGRCYLAAADPCEGSPTSNPSPITVFDALTWEEMAHLWGTFEMTTLAGYLAQLATFYNGAVICPERNNHGHAVILELRERYKHTTVYRSPHDHKHGWLSSPRWKVAAVDNAATAFKDGQCTLHTHATVMELQSIEAASLQAPPGSLDDRATTVFIGLAALRWPHEPEEGEGDYRVAIAAPEQRRERGEVWA